MRLGDVDDQERGAVAVGLVEPFEGPNLGPEGRSSAAPEKQDHRPFPDVLRQAKARYPILAKQ